MKGWENITEEDILKLNYKKNIKFAVDKRTLTSKTKKKKNKYNAVKTEVNGIMFDSKAEAKYYSELLLLKKAGIVTSFVMQKDFTLQEAFTRENGDRVKAIRYRVDFVVKYRDGHEEAIDVKGVKTRVYINKKKQLLEKYPNINFIEID